MLLGALKTLGGIRLVGLTGAARGSVSSTIESCSSSDLPIKLLWRCRRASISTTPSSKHNAFAAAPPSGGTNTSARWGFHPAAALGFMGAIAGLGIACKSFANGLGCGPSSPIPAPIIVVPTVAHAWANLAISAHAHSSIKQAVSALLKLGKWAEPCCLGASEI